LNGAVLVARMLGLQNIVAMTPAGERQPASVAALAAGPADGEPGPPWLGADWLDAEGRCWTELSLARLAADERFLAVAR
jgi:hypothetical protein